MVVPPNGGAGHSVLRPMNFWHIHSQGSGLARHSACSRNEDGAAARIRNAAVMLPQNDSVKGA